MHYLALVLFFMVQVARPKVGKIAFLCYLILLIVFAFLTREGSWDYYGYLDYYECSISPSCDSVGFEPSYGYISQLAGSIAEEWGFELTYLFYIAVSIWIKISLMSRYSKMFGFAVFSFICYGYFVHDLTQIRASLSIAVLWMAYFYWIEKKFLLAVLALMGAVFFHISAVLGVVIVVARFFSTKILLILSIAALLLGNHAANVVNKLPDLGFNRLQVYVDALGSEALSVPQLNFYAVTIFVIVCIAIKNGVAESSGVDGYAINAMLLGVLIYLCAYFIPVIPIRILEILSSLYPFVAASAYEKSKSKTEKIFLVILFFGLFVNTAIKNNTRIDFILPWHNISINNMTEIQYDQFIRSQE